MFLHIMATTVAAMALVSALAWVYRGHIRRMPKFRFSQPVTTNDLAHTFAALGHGTLTHGNSVTIHQNGYLFDVLLEDFLAAKETIHLEAYLWEEGETCRRVTTMLMEKARQGLEVRVVIDAQGSKKFRDAIVRDLRSAGVDVRVYRPFNPLHPFRYNRRDHRKLAVVDARTAFIFGHGIADPWSGNADQPNRWRDTGARLHGPVVNQVQRAFQENWVATAHELLTGSRYFREQQPDGDTTAHLAYLDTKKGVSSVQALYLLAIASARSEILIQNPYFIPGRRSIDFLRSALMRGVRVRIMVPTDRTSDFPVVQHASHYFFGSLLPYGAEILEYERSGVHQKVMVIDRAWCSIGSTNFDLRSFYLNDEITLGMFDQRIAEELAAAFEADAEGASVWTTERWQKREQTHRLRDWVCALAAPHL
jgi:cardiolipin synthase